MDSALTPVGSPVHISGSMPVKDEVGRKALENTIMQMENNVHTFGLPASVTFN